MGEEGLPHEPELVLVGLTSQWAWYCECVLRMGSAGHLSGPSNEATALQVQAEERKSNACLELLFPALKAAFARNGSRSF